jgi:aspartate 1-decarboxylase
MLLQILKSKIHRATVTDASLDYEGSLTIDSAIMEKVGILPYEKVLVGNMANGNRFETYAIAGEPGSGVICLNGAVARLGKKGDLLTIMTFAQMEMKAARNFKPRVVVLGENNRIITERGT